MKAVKEIPGREIKYRRNKKGINPFFFPLQRHALNNLLSFEHPDKRDRQYDSINKNYDAYIYPCRHNYQGDAILLKPKNNQTHIKRHPQRMEEITYKLGYFPFQSY